MDGTSCLLAALSWGGVNKSAITVWANGRAAAAEKKTLERPPGNQERHGGREKNKAQAQRA